MKLSAKILSLIVLSTLLFSCGKQTEADKISEAQDCLNTATAANVSECEAKVEGLTSKGSYLIRCVARFIEEGFTIGTNSKISSMMSKISSSSGKTEGTEVLSVLAFTSKTTADANLTFATTAYDQCVQSGSKGLNLLASYARIATAVAKLASLLPTNGGTMNAAQMQAALEVLASTTDTATQAAVGSAVISAYQTNCTNGAGTSGDACTQFGSVITSTGGNPQSVGAMLGTCYKTPSTSGCQGFQ